eukprot:CAMPEP_0181339262 /NCGR_PEP_ID=MMETSP1101-20121128/29146_1 /TAXON_ID=46948 /ORGANISM="Rhodomonas abbreviata, Strain Caron Lab Isolate" /LENGTH=52 /DNA_ID=CAMNT_0023450187 /DNA_START=24 /DNA_END=179 /DNA_ORIENTATION=-
MEAEATQSAGGAQPRAQYKLKITADARNIPRETTLLAGWTVVATAPSSAACL